MNAIANKPRATRRKPAAIKKTTVVPQAYYPLATEATAAIYAAGQLDEALKHGDTLRFGRIAAMTLENLPADPAVLGWADDDIAEALFDAEALIRAATTATDAISPERWALLDRAYLLVDTAIGTLPQWEGMAPSGLGEQPEAEMLTAERQEVIRMASACARD